MLLFALGIAVGLPIGCLLPIGGWSRLPDEHDSTCGIRTRGICDCGQWDLLPTDLDVHEGGKTQ